LDDERIEKAVLKLERYNEIDLNLEELDSIDHIFKIKFSDFDYHSRFSFPPCMKILYT